MALAGSPGAGDLLALDTIEHFLEVAAEFLQVNLAVPHLFDEKQVGASNELLVLPVAKVRTSGVLKGRVEVDRFFYHVRTA